MANKYLDFDRQFSEMKRETITVRLFGEDVTIPAQIPAIIPIELARYEAKSNVPMPVLIRAANMLFGEKITEWAQRPDFTADMLGEIIVRVFGAINGTDEGDEEPEALTEDDMATAKTRKKK